MSEEISNEKLAELYEREGVEYIAKLYNVSDNTVYRLLEKAGIERRPRGRRPKLIISETA